MARLSVVMPTYNQGQFLADALDSIVRQEFRDWELFIVDDASKDRTRTICAAYLKDKRIHYQKREINGGGAGLALNDGFKRCRGEYETWWASDNILYSDAWRKMVAYLDANPDIDYVYSNGELAIMDSTGEVELRRKNLWEEVDQNWEPGKILAQGYFLGLMWVWRRELRERVGEFQKEPCEDADFVLRAEEAGFKFGFLAENLGWQRRHNRNLTHMVAGPGRWDKKTFDKARERRKLSRILS